MCVENSWGDDGHYLICLSPQLEFDGTQKGGNSNSYDNVAPGTDTLLCIKTIYFSVNCAIYPFVALKQECVPYWITVVGGRIAARDCLG